ncbi:MAG: hypothetical protein D6732_07555 [Methanobacteriota archaeon]|nr:MAG: hypothetical protein D6732_07555 [Euryarchaeota archaeon]
MTTYDYTVISSGLTHFDGSVVVRFNQSGVLGWPEGNYSIYHWTGSSIPFYVVSNSSGIFQIPGKVPDDWGSIKGLGYSATLSGALPLSLAFCTGLSLPLQCLLAGKSKRKIHENAS